MQQMPGKNSSLRGIPPSLKKNLSSEKENPSDSLWAGQKCDKMCDFLCEKCVAFETRRQLLSLAKRDGCVSRQDAVSACSTVGAGRIAKAVASWTWNCQQYARIAVQQTSKYMYMAAGRQRGNRDGGVIINHW
jgi:hypothetical protein